jgi:hypothetical protein
MCRNMQKNTALNAADLLDWPSINCPIEIKFGGNFLKIVVNCLYLATNILKLVNVFMARQLRTVQGQSSLSLAENTAAPAKLRRAGLKLARQAHAPYRC